MDEQFDNELRDRIREVFDNYEDPTADDGWMQLREKFPAEEKRRAIAWIWWGAAAGLLLFLGIGLRAYYNNNQQVQIAGNKPVHKQNGSIAKINNGADTAHKPAITLAQAAVRASSDSSRKLNSLALPHLATHNNGQKPGKHQGVLNDTSIKKNFIAKTTNKNIKRQQAAPVQPANPVQNQAATNGQQVLAVSPNKATQNPAVTNGQQALAVAPDKPDQNKVPSLDNPVAAPQLKTMPANPFIAVTPPPKKTINDMFIEKNAVKNEKKDKEVKVKTKKVVFAVYAATYFNYAKGSDNEINAGAGVTADIKLTENLRLVTGVTIAQNSLSYNSIAYNSGIPLAAVQTGGFLAASSVSTPGPTNFYGVSAADNVSKAASPTLKNYDASLVGLDIPVNLKYEFNGQKNNSYLLLGFSSGTFVNEAYTYKYNYPIVNSASLQQTQNQTTHNSFNSFYFAKTLNAAFGIGLPFGKNHVIIEPFFKYPLEGLGSQQIKFGSGGLNLKFNFQPAAGAKRKD